MMNETGRTSDHDLAGRILTMATQAMDLLRRFGREQIPAEELMDRLPEIGAVATMAEHWEELAGKLANAPALEVIQLLSTLESEVRYQLLRYGATSLYEDYRELETATARLKKTIQAHSLSPVSNGSRPQE